MKSYISLYHDRDQDKLLVWERPVGGGERTLKLALPPRFFYVPDEEGPYITITDERVKKLVFDTEDEFNAALKRHRVRFESDIRPDARYLMEQYYNVPTPVPYYAFIDIEVDYSSKIGFSSPENPYAPINAVTIYQSWTDKYLTYVVPPKGWTGRDTFEADIEKSWKENKLEFKPNVTICESERDLLLYMLDDLQEADIISGWNSEFFDLPYIMRRITRVLDRLPQDRERSGVAFRSMSFRGAAAPRIRMVDRFGTEAITYTLYGRTHLDYLDLFKKYTFEGRVSYSLANIAAEELDIPKLDYPGTLEQLYKQDFVHFCTYNARDVEVIVKLDQKFKFMQLVNQMAHENTVPYVAILGTVRYVETGIINRTHNEHHRIVVDRYIPTEDNEKVEGAVVMDPKMGLHELLGSVDITSLYPSVIRALNMSIETFVGQFINDDQDWIALRDDRQRVKNKPGNLRYRSPEEMAVARSRTYVLRLANGEEVEGTWEFWNAWLDENKYIISAFGTVFDQSKPGMVADTLTFWFQERKRLQAEKKKYSKLAKEEKDPEKKAEYEKQAEHYDLLQLTKKIQLNSTYGALLNEAFRMGRRELGGSTTATGREISLHMAETIGFLGTGQHAEIEKYQVEHIKKGKVEISNSYRTECDAIIYGDTDSVDGSTEVSSNYGTMSIQDLFNSLPIKWCSGAKEFATMDNLSSPCLAAGVVEMKPVRALYRHKVRKERWKITLESGREVIMTGDHSIMVRRNGELLALRPEDVNRDTDIAITIDS